MSMTRRGIALLDIAGVARWAKVGRRRAVKIEDVALAVLQMSDLRRSSDNDAAQPLVCAALAGAKSFVNLRRRAFAETM